MLEDIIKERKKKLEEINKADGSAFPAKVKRTATVSEILDNFPKVSRSTKKFFLVGRVTGLRDQGGLIFIDLEDETSHIQVVFKKSTFKNFNFLKSVIDRGDFISVGGVAFKTKRGEKSVDALEFKIISKSLRPIPTEWFGIEEIETRLRKRYLDLILNPEVKNIFKKKAIFWRSFRDYLLKNDFLEVETPVLESIPGGAEAEPFKTHHNALNFDFYLRISLELSLKKLLVGGFEKVFEIGRIFRNEGIDREHLQDYIQLEFYWAYHDVNDLMPFTEKLYKSVIKNTIGSFKTKFEGKTIDWGKKWPKVSYVDVFQKANKINPIGATKEELFKKAESLGLKPEKNLGNGRLIDLIFKKTVRPNLIQPCFLVEQPVELEPLAKRSEKNPKIVERFQIMACGTELGKGFSELNDPIDQRQRFEEQMKLREAGDKEAQQLDEDFLEALEYGMPPAAGFGVSERLFAVLMDKSVRETVIFPLMRSKNK